GSWCSQLAGHVIEMNRKALGQQFDLVYGGKSVAALKRLYFKETGFVPGQKSSEAACKKQLQAMQEDE
ncbi:MAG: hypothetical protein ABJQ21_08670, partial [Roseibium sp.]